MYVYAFRKLEGLNEKTACDSRGSCVPDASCQADSVVRHGIVRVFKGEYDAHVNRDDGAFFPRLGTRQAFFAPFASYC